LLAEIRYQGIHQESMSKQAGDKKTETFRLGRYQITFASDNEFFWEKLGDGNKIVTGNCTLESGILLMGPQQGNKGEQNKREYLQQLRRLPQWERARVWGRHDVLQPCQIQAKSKIPYSIQRPPQTPKRRPLIKKTGYDENYEFDKGAEKFQKNRFKNWMPSWLYSLWNWKPTRPNFSRVCSFLSSVFKLPSLQGVFFRRSWLIKPRTPPTPKAGRAKGKSWIIWVILALVGLLLALLLTTFYLVNRKSHGHYRSWEHYYRLKDH